ncbi:hypothetical protein [Streptosporangium jomthongense]|uniref:Uncharacterized protein n=1 Tax=Streptosporangium jomthongense TaxID=1193683 RepID=A0ABV8FG41_9ACTN
MGRHSTTWTESAHPRDPDGKFAHGGGITGRTATARGMPDILAGSDIHTRKDGDVALDFHVNGDLSITTSKGSVRIPEESVPDLKQIIRDIDSESFTPGHEAWLKRVERKPDGTARTIPVGMIHKDDWDAYSLHLTPSSNASYDDVRNTPAVKLREKDINKIDDALRRRDAASRVDTGYGDLDVFMTDDNKFGLRHLGDDGRPVEVVFDKKSFAKLDGATNVVAEGFDDLDENGPDEGVTHVDVDTNVGKVRVEQLGEWRGDGPEDRFKITPLDGDDWGIYVEGTHQKAFDAAWEKAVNAAEMAGFFNRFSYLRP